jgi:hypothetical protein
MANEQRRSGKDHRAARRPESPVEVRVRSAAGGAARRGRLYQRGERALDPLGDRTAVGGEPAPSGGAVAGGASAAGYVKSGQFTELFAARETNYAKICIGLQTIVASVARGFSFRSKEERLDVEGEALAWMIERMELFRVDAGKTAFAYFWTMAINIIRRQLDPRRWMYCRNRAGLFCDVFDGQRGRGRSADRYAAALDRTTPYTRASR